MQAADRKEGVAGAEKKRVFQLEFLGTGVRRRGTREGGLLILVTFTSGVRDPVPKPELLKNCFEPWPRPISTCFLFAQDHPRFSTVIENLPFLPPRAALSLRPASSPRVRRSGICIEQSLSSTLDYRFLFIGVVAQFAPR